jgi:hypothetical protein
MALAFVGESYIGVNDEFSFQQIQNVLWTDAINGIKYLQVLNLENCTVWFGINSPTIPSGSRSLGTSFIVVNPPIESSDCYILAPQSTWFLGTCGALRGFDLS